MPPASPGHTAPWHRSKGHTQLLTMPFLPVQQHEQKILFTTPLTFSKRQLNPQQSLGHPPTLPPQSLSPTGPQTTPPTHPTPTRLTAQEPRPTCFLAGGSPAAPVSALASLSRARPCWGQAVPCRCPAWWRSKPRENTERLQTACKPATLTQTAAGE